MTAIDGSAANLSADDETRIAAAVPESGVSTQSLFARWGKWWGKKAGAGQAETPASPSLSTREANRQRVMLRQCFEERLTDVAANRAAQIWQDTYRKADAGQRKEMLQLLGEVSVALATGADKADTARSSSDLTHALSHVRVRFFKRFNALPDGLPFLLELRADMLTWRKQIGQLKALDADLEGLLSNWFDVGLLELRRISWDSPASLLEKLINYEAVHEIASWADLRNRLDSDRRCYAFFHARMPNEPLIFVEVAFCAEMAGSVQKLLDESAPLEDLNKARWAIFYSISNTQQGLRGVSFGNFLLKRVIEELNRELPKIKNFATLSPMPGFSDWLKKRTAQEVAGMIDVRRSRQADADDAELAGAQLLARLQQESDTAEVDDAVRTMGFKLAAHYLVNGRDRNLPLDSVAKFHLGNGSRVERFNWRADLSKKGRSQSCSMMVNYVYDLDALDANLAKLSCGKPETSRAISKLL